MKKSLLTLLYSAVFILFISGCQDNKPGTNPSPTAKLPIGKYTECKDPRPEMCTSEFRPVCGNIDTGTRCVTAPCPSNEYKTASNACTACADKKIDGYWLSACPE